MARPSTTLGSSSMALGSSLQIDHIRSAAIAPEFAAAVRALCDAAYGEPTGPYFAMLGRGDHLLGLDGGTLVSHLMWVTRWLQPGDGPPIRTAYVEMVATAPQFQGRGYASALLEHFVPLAADYELAALSPATEGLYARLGWRSWRGPLSMRRDGRPELTPDERVMILTLPRTPALDLDAPMSVEWRPGEVW